MKRMGIEAIYRRPNTSKPEPDHKISPYLLRKLPVTRSNQMWAMDLTHIPMARGFGRWERHRGRAHPRTQRAVDAGGCQTLLIAFTPTAVPYVSFCVELQLCGSLSSSLQWLCCMDMRAAACGAARFDGTFECNDLRAR